MNFKKIIGQLTIATLLAAQLSTPITLLAQEGQVVDYQFSVKLNLPDETTQEQKHVKYDIFNRDTNELIYSYRETNPENEVIALFEGNYRLRIYEWDSISQDGQLIVDETEQSIAEPTQEELNQNKTKRVHRLPGDEIILGDGSIVYDIEFEVKASDYLFDEVAQEYQGFFNLYLADPQTAQANDDKSEISQPSNEEEGQTGSVVIQVIDNQTQQPIEGVILNLSGTIIQTDVNGMVRIDGIEAGQYTLTSESVPEGYEGLIDELIDIQALSETLVTLPLNPSETTASTANAIFDIVDTDGNSVSGVGILIDGIERYSDDRGSALFNELPAGTYHYELNGIPAGYQGQASGEFSIDPTQGDFRTVITVEKVADTGSVMFRAVDQNGTAVPNVGIWFLDQMIYTLEDGTVTVNGLELQDYTYSVMDVPKGYHGARDGAISLVRADETIETLILLEKEADTAILTVKVLDNEGTPIPGMRLLIDNEHIIETDENGQAYHRQITIGDHQIALSELPDQYSIDQAEQVFNMSKEGKQIEFILDRVPATETVHITLVDQFGQVISNSIISLLDRQATTDNEGKVIFENLPHGVHNYQVSQLPEKFDANYEGQVEVNKDTKDHTIELTRQVVQGQATLTVVDQDQQPVRGLKVKFGGLSGSTNGEGIVYFDNLDLGQYHFQLVELPEGIDANQDEQVAVIEEGDEFKEQLTVTRIKTGSAQIFISDEEGQALSQIEVVINEQSYRTDEEGKIILNELNPGEYKYQVVNSNQHRFDGTTNQIVVEAGQITEVKVIGEKLTTTTQLTLTEPTSSETPSTTESSTIATTSTSTIHQANLKQLIDRTSNIEIWLHPDDENRVHQLVVERVTQNLPTSLANKEGDIFNIRLLDANGQDVALRRTAQVKIPTRAINSQVQLVKIINNQLTTINHTIHNQRATFKTQQLGQYALVYGDKKVVTTKEPTTTPQTQTISVETSTSIERRIPNTGESNNIVYIVLAALLIGVDGLLVFNKKK